MGFLSGIAGLFLIIIGCTLVWIIGITIISIIEQRDPLWELQGFWCEWKEYLKGLLIIGGILAVIILTLSD